MVYAGRIALQSLHILQHLSSLSSLDWLYPRRITRNDNHTRPRQVAWNGRVKYLAEDSQLPRPDWTSTAVHLRQVISRHQKLDGGSAFSVGAGSYQYVNTRAIHVFTVLKNYVQYVLTLLQIANFWWSIRSTNGRILYDSGEGTWGRLYARRGSKMWT